MMLVYAVLLQRDELTIIKEDRDTTRSLLSGQERINSLQEAALRKQVFEQSFNSLLTLASNEMSRLSAQALDEGRLKALSLMLAGYQVRELLQVVSKGAMPNSEHTYARTTTYRIFFLVNLLIHLATLIEQSAPEVELKQPLAQLITAIIDQDVARCVVWFVVENRIQGGKMKNFEQFMRSYMVLQMLSADERIMFEAAISTIDDTKL